MDCMEGVCLLGCKELLCSFTYPVDPWHLSYMTKQGSSMLVMYLASEIIVDGRFNPSLQYSS